MRTADRGWETMGYYQYEYGRMENRQISMGLKSEIS